MTPLLWQAYFFAIGAAVGSFLNVVIYRVPTGGSIVRPASKCPACSAPIKWYFNIPMVGWIVLRGKCADCGTKISFRYPLVELLTALLFTACYLVFGATGQGIVYMALCSALVAVIFIDIDHLIIPDVITLPGIVVGFVCAWFFLPMTMWDSFFGFLAGGGIFFLIAVIKPGGMGGGDIKLMAMVGAFLGWKAALLIIFLGSLIGSVGGIFGITFFGKTKETLIPFGPYLAFATIISLFFKDALINSYLSLFTR
ncbi:MAG: prepilin peptidase [Nitrospinae bacterium]|nr:prepilin peptidase [Nitrospinota bacterium]